MFCVCVCLVVYLGRGWIWRWGVDKWVSLMALWSSERPSVKQSGRRIRVTRRAPPPPPLSFFCKVDAWSWAGNPNFNFKVGENEGVQFRATGIIQEPFGVKNRGSNWREFNCSLSAQFPNFVFTLFGTRNWYQLEDTSGQIINEIFIMNALWYCRQVGKVRYSKKIWHSPLSVIENGYLKLFEGYGTFSPSLWFISAPFSSTNGARGLISISCR